MVGVDDAIVFLKSTSERTVPSDLAKATGTIAQRLRNIYYRLNVLAQDLARIYEITKCIIDSGAPCYSKEQWKTCNICSHFWATITDKEVAVTRIKQSASVSFNGDEVLFKVDNIIEFRVTANTYALKYKNMAIEISPKDIEEVRKNIDKALYTLRGIEKEVKIMKNALEKCIKLKGLTC